MANSQATATNGASAPMVLPNQQNDDESEWEYEYSTTETETYYVTMDISKPDFMTRQAPALMNGRGGFNKERRPRGGFPTATGDEMLGTDGENDHDDDEGQQGDPSQPQNKSSGEEDGPHKLQILGLHSTSPIVAYKGHVYEGQWSQNVGTELLMAMRDEDNPLPALRHMDGGIDLLAASATRITLTERIIHSTNSNTKRRQQKVRFDDEADEDNEDELHDLTVPRPEPGASQDRYDQGDFLAKLIALKKQKGETDEVPVIARGNEASTGRESRKVQNGKGRGRGGERGLEIGNKRGSGNPKATARAQRGADKPSGRPRGRPRGRISGRSRGRPRTRAVGHSNEGSGSSTSMSGVGSATDEEESRPTPSRWADLRDQSSAMELDNDHENAAVNTVRASEAPRGGAALSSENDSADEMDIDG